MSCSSAATPPAPAPPATNLLYTGEHFDTDAQQYYLRARYYNPSNGRFNRIDPYSGNKVDPQSLHKYLYCHANPVNAIDPTGMFIGGIAGVVAVVAIAAVAINIGVSIYNGVRHGQSAGSIAWQVFQNLAVFMAIIGATLLSGPIAIAAGIALLITAIVGIINLVRSWTEMDSIDKIVAGVTVITFLMFAGAVRAGAPPAASFKGHISVLPESYFSKVAIDMRNAPPRSGTTISGIPRNHVYFWRQMKTAKPEYLSSKNSLAIKRGKAPTVDETWTQHNPQHLRFMNSTLVHHHIGQGRYAVAVPDPVHTHWTKLLHTKKAE